MSGDKAPKASRRGFDDKEKPKTVLYSNITAAKAVCDAVRTSLGPKGMDKMIEAPNGDVTITNDGATILKQMKVLHPTAKMLVELSKAQDIEAGDGTTTVVVIAGSLLDAAQKLLTRGVKPKVTANGFRLASSKAIEILESMAIPVDLSDRESLLKSATTSLNSKVVCLDSKLLAPMAVDAVLKIIDPAMDTNVDLKDIKVIKHMSGTVEDSELIDGLVFMRKASGTGGPKKIEKAKIGLIQFCLSPPKTDMDNQVIVSDYTQMDQILKEERMYIINMVKQIKKAGCNVLLVQKSILRDALCEMSLHFLAKMKIMVIRDVEREDIGFISKTLNCRPIASLDHFVPEALGYAELVEEIHEGPSAYTKVTGVANPTKTVTLMVRGSNSLVLDEAERSLHDALCVVRSLVKRKALIAGGGAPEIEMALRLSEYSQTVVGPKAYAVRAFAEALEIVPYTLSENAGLNPVRTVTELRARHANGEKTAGINIRKGFVTDILEENVVQPLLVTSSAVILASETVQSILKIDDIVNTVN